MDADYISVNISSPNTRDLRHLQQGDDLAHLLHGLADGRSALEDRTGRRVPLAVKIAPDLDEPGIGSIARRCVESGMDAVIATNTTVARPDTLRSPHRDEAGGLSGAPLTEASTRVVELLVRHLDGALPVIASGGLMTAADAVDKMSAGASLVQLYSGLVYRGPRLVRECIEALDRSPRNG
jgi:dihydroorotate dehydrogenase